MTVTFWGTAAHINRYFTQYKIIFENKGEHIQCIPLKLSQICVWFDSCQFQIHLTEYVLAAVLETDPTHPSFSPLSSK